MVCLTRLFLGFITLLGFYSTVHSQLDEIEFTSDAQCFGAGLIVNATCPNSTVIALNNIQVGTRPTDHGCHGNETAGDGTGCCQSANDACEFDFPVSDNVLYHDQCNGVPLCRPGVQIIDVIHGSCNTSVYPGFTQYMYFNYFCVADERISHMDLGHLTVEDAAVYIQSPNYPTSNISSSVSALSCSVETDNCNAIILIYVIERNLADVTNSTQCDQTQSLSIIEEDGSTLVNWTCNDNTYTISQPLQTAGSYLQVNLTNTMATDGGKFWIGFKASLPANLTLECPAIEKQDCFPTTSSTTTSTITTSTTASTTTFTTSDPTTTTSSTTTTTITGSTTSTATTTSTSTATTTSSATSTTSTTSTTTTTPLNATTTSTTPDTTTFSATSTTSTTSTDTTSTSLAVTDFSTTSTTIVNSTATTTLSNATTTSTNQATATSSSASTLGMHSAANTTTHTTEMNTTATNNETVVDPGPLEESFNTTLIIVITCCIGAALIVAVIIGFIKRRDCKKEKNTEPEEPASKKGDPNESLKMVANEAEVSESKNSERKATVYVENEERNGSSDNNHGSHNDRNLVSSNESVEENGSGDSRHSLDMTSTHLNKDATDVSLNDESINSETPGVENLPTSNDDDRIDTEHTQNIENGQSSDNNKEEKVVEEHSTGESNQLPEYISESPSSPRPAWREEEVTGTEKGDFKENTTRQLINGHEQIRTNVEPVTVVPIRRERRRDDSAYVRNYKHITASFFSDVTLAVRMQRLQRSFLKRKKKVNPKR